MKNYYYLFGISKDSSLDEIKKSYKLHASKIHPDKHNGDKFFEEKFKEINEAYEVLSDAVKRKSYDSQLNSRIFSYDDAIKRKELVLRKKENELKIIEKNLLKKEKEYRLKLNELKKREEEINRQKEEIIIKKMENDDNYLIIQAPYFMANVRNIFVKNWHKAIGEPVKTGEVLVKIQSDRAENMDIVSESDGFLIYAVKAGTKVPVGNTLAIISK